MPWVSSALTKPDLILPVVPMHPEETLQSCIDALNSMLTQGVPLSSDMAISKFRHAYSDSRLSAPEDGLCNVGGYGVVSGGCIDVFEGRDLGAGGLLPMTIFQHDGATTIAGNYRILSIGIQRKCLLPKQSRNLRANMFAADKWELGDIKRDDIVLSSKALGEGDIWIDPQLPNRFFISDDLAHALKSRNYLNTFYVTRCRVQ